MAHQEILKIFVIIDVRTKGEYQSGHIKWI